MASLQLQNQYETETVTLGGTVVAGDALEQSVLGVATRVVGVGSFLGFALEDGVSGDVIQVAVRGIATITVGSSTSSAVGADVWASDHETFTVTGGTNQKIGVLKKQAAASSTTWDVAFSAMGLTVGAGDSNGGV